MPGEVENLSQPSLSFDGLPFVFCHLRRMLFDSDTADLAHAGGAVGAEDESENFRNPIIEHAAVLGILKIFAIGARCKLVA
jgi:hypothetical protein